MSDNAADHFANQTFPRKDEGKPERRSITLRITLHPNTQIDYEFPANKILAYGLLGAAYEKLREMNITSLVQQASTSRGGVGGLLKRMNGGHG